MKKIFLMISGLIGGLLLLLIILLVLLASFRIPIDLSSQKAFFEWAAAEALERKVVINGRIKVSTSLQPSFTIHEVHIRNQEGFSKEDFLSIQKAHLQIALLPLLKGKISLRELSAQGVTVNLQENEQGKNNWAGGSSSEREKPPGETARLLDTPGLASDTLVIDHLGFEDIALSFTSPDIEKPFVLTIKKCTGSAQPGKPTSLELNGSWQTHPFTSRIKVNSLEELLEQDRSWIQISTEIAATELVLEGAIDLVTVLDSFSLKATLRGAHLNSLNELFQVDLLPLESYEAVAELTLQKKLLNLNKLLIRVGESSLEGNMVIDAKGERPDVLVSMTAPLIQLNDFDLKDKRPETTQPEPEQASTESTAEKADAPDPLPAGGVTGLVDHLSQDLYKEFDARITVQLDKLYSGKDLVGSGILEASLQESRFSIDPLQLDLPGGALMVKMSLLPGQETSAASLSVKVENFDFGIAARRANPETNMGGTLNLDIDLQSKGGSLDEILANGNGHIDFSAIPVNLNSGIMDLWVVNLLAAIITRSNKEGAPINCMINRWSMQDGVLTPDAFAVDTGIMRICGSGKIDLKNDALSIRIAPAPKRERFFSLATPFAIKGKISDIKMGIATGGILGTSIRFVVSPVTTPLSWLLSQKIPDDGSDICSLPIGPEKRSEKRLPGCRR